MPFPWRAGASTLDAATALCATLNLAYFLDRLFGLQEPGGRRVAAFALAVVSLGVLLESVFLLASAAASGEELFASPQWALVRVLPFAGAASISALIVRRAIGGDPR